MVDIDLAKKAEMALIDAQLKTIKSTEYFKLSNLFNQVKGNLIYVGCGTDISSLFLFENASCYIHQNLNNPNAPKYLKVLEDAGIIDDFKITFNLKFRRESSFKYKGMKKKLIEVYGSSAEYGESYGNEGDIAFNIPSEAKENLEAIYFFGMPYRESIKIVQINLLPYLKIGGVFQGTYPYGDGEFEGATPEKLGLIEKEGTFVKIQNKSSSELEKIINYSLLEYVDFVNRVRVTRLF